MKAYSYGITLYNSNSCLYNSLGKQELRLFEEG